jgi:hypothetical protein
LKVEASLNLRLVYGDAEFESFKLSHFESQHICYVPVQSIDEAAAAIKLIEACLLVVDEFCLDWWAQLKDRCPSLRAAVLMEERCAQPPTIEIAPLNSLEGAMSDLQVWTERRLFEMGEIMARGRAMGDERGRDLLTAPGEVALICFTSGEGFRLAERIRFLDWHRMKCSSAGLRPMHRNFGAFHSADDTG